MRKLKNSARAICLAFAFLSLTACSDLMAEQQLNAHLSQGREYQDCIEKCRALDNYGSDYAPAVYAHKVKIKALYKAVNNNTVTNTITDDEDAAFDALAKAADNCETQLKGNE